MNKNSKKLFLNSTAIETRRTTSKTAGGGLANYAIELGQWIENRIKDNTIKVGEQHVVDDISTRDNLFDVTKGDVAYVVDASADVDVNSGAALYVYDGSDWQRIAEFESLSVTSANITEGTLNTATNNRVVNMGDFQLDFENNSSSGNNSNIRLHPQYSYINTFASSTGLEAKVQTYNNGQVQLYSSNQSYRIGVGNSTIPPLFISSTSPHVLSLNPNNGVMYVTDTGSYFISDSNLSPASAGSPTFTEVEVYVNSLGSAVIPTLKNRVLYYTGTNTSTDAYTHAYYLSGNAKLYELGGSSINNITEGALNVATSDRTVDMGAHTLEIIGTNEKLITNTSGNVSTNLLLENNTARLSQTDTTGVNRSIAANTGGIFINNDGENYINLLNNGELNLFSITNTYRIGGLSGQPLLYSNPATSPKTLYLDPSGYLKHGLTSAYFISDTNLNPSVTGSPTLAEVETYLTTIPASTLAGLKNRFLYYTGDDVSTSEITYVYYLTGNNKVMPVLIPSGNETFIILSTVLNSSFSLSPPVLDIQTYLNSLPGGIAAYKDKFILYKYSLTGSIVKSFYITSTEEVVTLYEMYPYENVTFNTPIASIDSSYSTQKVGSIAVPFHLYVNGNRQIRNVSYKCEKDTSSPAGTNVANISVKDESGNNILSFTIDSFYGGGGTNLGGTFINSSTNGNLFLEVTSITGNINFLSVTMRVGA